MSRRKRKPANLPDLEIDVTAPVADRIAAVIEATGGDPYHFRSGDVEVEVAPLFSWSDDLLAYQVIKIA